MYLYPSWVDASVEICDNAAFSDSVRYGALLQNRADETMFASIMLKDDIAVLSEEQFNSALKAKQKGYLVSLKSVLQACGAGMDEILKVNDRLKGL